LAAALAAVGEQLPPREASAHAIQAVDRFDSLWRARTAPADRAFVAEAQAAVWTRLDPTDAAARARRAAGDLEGAIREAKAVPKNISDLAIALSAVYNHLDPAERGARAKAVADTLVAALRRPRNDPKTFAQLWGALAPLSGHFDRPGGVRTADVLRAVLDDPNVQQFPFYLYEKAFKTIAARLDERDLQRLLEHPLAVGPMQRILLDVLERSKKRSFRNTWDYLDSTESHGNETDVPSPGTNR
jgi:hypothetical protein